MKTKLSEFDDDYIGGGRSLTVVEEQAISEYLKMRKELNSKKKSIKAKKTAKKGKSKA